MDRLKVLGIVFCLGWLVIGVGGSSVSGCVVPVGERIQEKTSSEIAPEESGGPEDASVPEEAAPQERKIVEQLPLPPPVSDGIEAVIVHVTDGDTVYIRTGIGARAQRVRIKGINTPECKKGFNGSFQFCEADDDFYGLKAYEYVKGVVDAHPDKKVKVTCVMAGDECETDAFGRYLATLRFVDDNKDLAEDTIRNGAGWTYTSFSFERMADYCRAEAEAIREKRGMWSEGRAAVKAKMSQDNLNWYYNRSKARSHDGICDAALGESFANLAGE